VERAEVDSAPPEAPKRPGLALLTLAALGIVYGDIGTSPLYALKEAFGEHGVTPTPDHVLGVLSLILWSLILVVVVKYLTFVLRADNRGEGGVLALMALLTRRRTDVPSHNLLIVIGLLGAALLYGDGMITPAISVLGAVEGVEVALPTLGPLVVPITCALLIGLFLVQRFGTARVGVTFGPIMLVWFLTLAVAGLTGIARNPHVLTSVDPRHAIEFLMTTGVEGFLTLGAVVLVVTGVEALYADLGHFGIRPIRRGWYLVVFPALILNYMGQGALLIDQPAAARNPFYLLLPTWGLYPMIALATAAAVIASQALISGAFSLTRQAIQLGYLPRMTIVHTSKHKGGQIYIPEINSILMLACIALVLGFRSTSNLAGAYGMAVVGTMLITTVLLFFVLRQRWRWPLPLALLVVALFLVIDGAFLAANVIKITHGGWFPLVVAAIVYGIMSTWRRGRLRLSAKVGEPLPESLFVDDVGRRKPTRVPGAAVFLTREASGIPRVLLHYFKHVKTLHERVILLTIINRDIPIVEDSGRVEVKPIGEGLFRVVARYGFSETPSMPDVLEACRIQGLPLGPMDTTFVLGREALLIKGRQGMARWRKRLFAFLNRNAQSATAFFGIPPNRVVELGAQIEL
jgi:KUP system potassium uptake protein